MSDPETAERQESALTQTIEQFITGYVLANQFYLSFWSDNWDRENSRFIGEGIGSLNYIVGHIAWLSGILYELTGENKYHHNLYGSLVESAVNQVMLAANQTGEEAASQAKQVVEEIMIRMKAERMIEQSITAGRSVGHIIALGTEPNLTEQLLEASSVLQPQ
jgi:hypothetical protein